MTLKQESGNRKSSTKDRELSPKEGYKGKTKARQQAHKVAFEEKAKKAKELLSL